MSRALGTADGAKSVYGAGIGGGLWVARSGEPSQVLWAGSSRPCALAEAGGDELRCAGKLVCLAVFGGAHAVGAHDVCSQAQTCLPALMADESAFFVLCDASVDPGTDWLTHAGCGLVGMLTTCPLVMLEADPV